MTQVHRTWTGGRDEQLVGRGEACSELDVILEDARAGRRALALIRGEAGAGKSALLAYAEARAGGMLVLRATGVRGDADVPFAGLLELLLPLIELLDDLPAPQRGALCAALARARLSRALDRFAVGAGVLSLLDAAAGRTGIVVLVDDVQWLDVASAEAIVFAARRLAGSRAAFVFAARDGEQVPADLSGMPVISACRLDRWETATLVARVRGMPVSAELAERIFAVTGGNPLAITELPDGDGAARPIGAAPVSASIEDEFAARAAALSPAARRALLVVAADDAVSATTYRMVLLALGVDGTAVEEAVLAGLLVGSHARLAFRHPLVRSAVFQRATPGERRSVHAALADALGADTDWVRRTLHRAAAADAPDAALAADLEQIGDEAFARHAYAAAALTYEQAAALTPDGVPADMRLFGAACSSFRSGDRESAGVSLEAALAVCRSPRLHAQLVELQGRMLWRAGEAEAALDLLLAEARRVASSVPDQAVALLVAAFDAAMTQGDVGRGVEVAAEVAALRGDTALPWALCLAGRPWHETAAALRAAIGASPHDDADAHAGIACLAGWLGTYRDAYSHAVAARDAAQVQGAPLAAADAAMLASDFAFATGDWNAAASHGHEAANINRHAGQVEMLRSCLWGLGALAAARGQVLECDRIVAELDGSWAPLTWFGIRNAAACVRGMLRLGMNDAPGAVDAFERGVDLDVEQVGFIPVTPAFDLVEARIRAGDRKGADAAVARLAAHAHQPWAVAALGRSRGQLAGPRDGDALFEGALQTSIHHQTPFEEARTRLLYGEWLRRARRRIDAREQLRAACATFDRLGAEPWAARACEELGATGETHVARGGGDPFDSLTAQERRIAILAADGVSNRDIAARLFLSPKTIEAHLHRVYRKLGVARRTELRTRLPDGGAFIDRRPRTYDVQR